MPIFHWIIPALWLVFIVYWGISALNAKRSIRDAGWWWRHLAIRLAIAPLIIIAVQIPGIRHALQAALSQHPSSMLVQATGVLLTGLGIGFAIAARLYIGRNWGMPMSRKEDPELVTGGPYAFVRHPIYTGILVALLGSVIGYSLMWLPVLLLSVPYFIYCARREEALMCEQFPAQYPAYKRRTKMLLPFLL
ncbi:methyltransferase family protein [Bradyrhizobium sp. HKCCYLS1011]|uniref:methyltransferase family protein n=1 Tax=Bradyrhizobium sp. HKCCYLS1011 TaxID=3420733 RepID=UPI003EB90236